MPTIRPATPEDHARLPWFDHTRAEALHTCHMWGVVRYMHNRTLEEPGRALPLELGSAAHRAFAAHRLWWLYQQCDERDMTRLEVILRQGTAIFGDAWPSFYPMLDSDEPQSITIHAVTTSDYYDDPHDRKRTVSNLENSLMHYLTRYEIDEYPILVHNDLACVELPTSMVVDYGDGAEMVYNGRVDAIALNGSEPFIIDNKTASNVGNRWEMRWDTSHQVTGYCLQASLLIGQEVNSAVVQGLQIPLPKSSEWSGYVWHQTHRSKAQTRQFFDWLRLAYDIWMKFKDRPFEATRLTHSCYRYFRPCQFIPICYQFDEDPPPTLEEMVEASWHPHAED